jgi:hypothetical protein
MRILVAVSVRELKFVGVEFEKTRNLKLVTQNFFVPLHPEKSIGHVERAFGRLRRVKKGLRPVEKGLEALRLLRCCAAQKSKFRK